MLRTGMLWFDNSTQRSLRAKISLAAKRYQDKYGEPPNVCYVHGEDADQDAIQEGTLRIIRSRDILPHHYWLGVASRGGGKRE